MGWGEFIDLQIVQCTNCGLVYTNPSFREAFLYKVYPSYPENANITKKKLLSNPKWKDIIEYIVAKFRNNKEIFICDIGTRFGGLPLQLNKIGFVNSFGIEINSSSVKIGNKLGIKIYKGMIPDLLDIGIDRVNCFIMDDVLEHLVDPMRDIQILSSLQQKGDILILRQMDIDSLGHKIYGKYWYYLQPAAHQYYFNNTSISKLLEKNGYKVILIKKSSFISNLKPFLSNIKKFIFSFFVNKNSNIKINYLEERYALNDIFLVVGERQ